MTAAELPLALTMGDPAGIGGEIAMRRIAGRLDGNVAALDPFRKRPGGLERIERSGNMRGHCRVNGLGGFRHGASA